MKCAKIILACLAITCLPMLAQAGQPKVMNVWPGKAPGETGKIGKEKATQGKGKRPVLRITNVTRPTLTIYRPAKEKDTGAAVVICPGGGYHILAWDLEGTEVAEWLNSIGVTGIVVKYRVPRRPDASGKPPHKQPLQDAQRAMSLVRSNAKTWGIDPNRIGILGFSAGGHLSAHVSTNFDRRAYQEIDEVDKVSCRPDFTILIYPAYLDKKGKLSSEIRVSKKTPPMFFAHANNDGVSPENSVRLYLALRKARVAAELHIYTTGGHGFGLRANDTASSTWPRSCAHWMRTHGWLEKQNK